MLNPVTTSDGYTYEQSAIKEWLENNDTSPITGAPLRDKKLIPNYALKGAINEFKDDPERKRLIDELSLRDDTTEPAFPNQQHQSHVELLIVGTTGVGKSSLLRHLRDGSFIEDTDSTIGLDFEQKRYITGNKKCRAKIWDTSGQTVFRDTIRTQYQGADVIMFVFDVSRPDTLKQLEPYIADAKASLARGRTQELVLVCNKIDLRFVPSEEDHLIPKGTVSPDEASAFVEIHGLHDYREVSARTGANVKLTFNRSLAHAAYRAPVLGSHQGVVFGGRKPGQRPGQPPPKCLC